MGEEASPSSACSLSYILSTAVYSRVHHKGLVYSFGNFCRRIFNYATAPWEGETIVITPDEIDAAVKLGEKLEIAEENERMLRTYAGYGSETWVPPAQYEKAGASSQDMKQKILEVYSENEVKMDDKRALIMACWPLEDMDEVEFEEYI